MKFSTLTSVLALTILVLLNMAIAYTLPPFASTSGAYSAVVLQLNDGHVAQCTLSGHHQRPSLSRSKADMVSSKLVASGKMACKGAHEHRDGMGKTLVCVSGQLGSEEDAVSTLKDACEGHQGIHYVV